MRKFEPKQRVRVVTPEMLPGYMWNDDPDVIDPKYWGKAGEVVTVEWDDHGATQEDPYYRVHIVLDPSEGRFECVTDMFWGEDLIPEEKETE